MPAQWMAGGALGPSAFLTAALLQGPASLRQMARRQPPLRQLPTIGPTIRAYLNHYGSTSDRPDVIPRNFNTSRTLLLHNVLNPFRAFKFIYLNLLSIRRYRAKISPTWRAVNRHLPRPVMLILLPFPLPLPPPQHQHPPPPHRHRRQLIEVPVTMFE